MTPTTSFVSLKIQNKFEALTCFRTRESEMIMMVCLFLALSGKYMPFQKTNVFFFPNFPFRSVAEESFFFSEEWSYSGFFLSFRRTWSAEAN